MKQLLLNFIIIILFGAFSGCKKEVIKDPPKNACPIFLLNEGHAIVWERGTEWVEPGFHCSEVEIGGDDLNASVIIDYSELDINVYGLYIISYTATNSLGCTKTAYREVLVTNPNPPYSIEGEYNKNFGTSFMYITEHEVEGFYNVSQILDYSQGDLSGTIGFLSEGIYIVPEIYFKTTTDYRHVYISGYAYFDPVCETNGCITFDIIAFYGDDGSHYADYSVTWYRSE